MHQDSSFDPDHLIFLHISKTGGTSLGIPLRLIYGYRHSMQVGGDKQLESYRRLSDRERRDIRLLKGHVPFGTHEHCPGTAKYVTLVREPVSRIDSFHRMLLDEYTPSQFARSTLKEFVSSGHKTYTPNAQIRAITGTAPGEPVGSGTLERAKDILDEHFVVAGTTDRFDASVLLMKERLGWPIYPVYVRSRTGSPKKKQPIADQVQQKIREQNQWDLRLYEHVSQKLAVEIEARGGAFQRRLRQYKRFNRAFGFFARRPLQLFRSARDWAKEKELFRSLQ
jgi:hypothetical protein